MSANALEHFIHHARLAWGPLTSHTVQRSRQLIEQLACADPSREPWLRELEHGHKVNTELYRDPDHGFVLLTHTEERGLYRPPHNHGRGWVIYAVQRGEIEMSTYAIIDDGRLVRRERHRMGPGDCRVFLPGDIHDTRCLSGAVRMFRLTSCDVAAELADGHMTIFPEERDHEPPRDA